VENNKNSTNKTDTTTVNQMKESFQRLLSKREKRKHCFAKKLATQALKDNSRSAVSQKSITTGQRENTLSIHD
jgi:hypothetical protein